MSDEPVIIAEKIFIIINICKYNRKSVNNININFFVFTKWHFSVFDAEEKVNY